jgi:hypothetical protein
LALLPGRVAPVVLPVLLALLVLPVLPVLLVLLARWPRCRPSLPQGLPVLLAR